MDARVPELFSNGKIFSLLLAVLLAGGLVFHLGSILNHNTAWYLLAGQKFLEGGRLYRDIIEVNPPLALFLNLPALLLARVTTLPPIDAFVVYAYLVMAASLFLTYKTLRRDAALAPSFVHGFVLALALALVACASEAFGDREHLMFALIAPYITLAFLRARERACPWPLAAFVGAFAAFGFALKPHYLLIPIALEIYRLVLTRRWLEILRPETLALGLALALYLAAIVFLTPEYLEMIVPYALESYNQAYRLPFWTLLVRPEIFFLPLAIAIHLGTRKSAACPELTGILLIAAGCFFATYILQMKGWFYHLYPASACLFMAYGTLLCDSGRAAALRLLVALELVLLLAIGIQRGPYTNPFIEAAVPTIERHAAGKSVAFFGTNLWPAFPSTNYAGAEWGARFPTLWMLPGIIHKKNAGNSNPKLDEIESYVRDSVIADLEAEKPAIVIVDVRDRKAYFEETQFDYIAYFLTDPRFAALWRAYEPVPDDPVAEWGFRLYRRKD